MFNSYVKLPDGSAVLITSDFFISSPWRWLRMLVQLQSNCHSKGNFFGPEAAGVGIFFGQPLGTVDFHFANWRLWWKKTRTPQVFAGFWYHFLGKHRMSRQHWTLATRVDFVFEQTTHLFFWTCCLMCSCKMHTIWWASLFDHSSFML